jgi:hypothetical protein
MLIRKHEGQYVVTMEFASDRQAGPVDSPAANKFDELKDAMIHANNQRTEYGVRWTDDVLESL